MNTPTDNHHRRTAASATPRISIALTLLAAGLLAAPLAAQNDAPASRFDSGVGKNFGHTRPVQQLDITAPHDGLLASVKVDIGDSVNAGEVIAHMDAAAQQAILLAAELRAQGDAEIRRQQVLVDEAKVQLDRAVALFESETVSEWEVRQARVQWNAAKAALDYARHQKTVNEANAQLERVRLEKFDIIAPFDGRVLIPDLKPGETPTLQEGATLQRAQKILTLADLSKLEADVQLPVEWYYKLDKDRTYELDAGAPVNGKIEARLTLKSPVINSASGTFRATFTIDNQDGQLPAGFSVKLISPEGKAAVVEQPAP